MKSVERNEWLAALGPHLMLSRGDHLPLGEELGAVKRLADNASALGRRVGPGGPDDLLHLGQDAGQVVGVLGNHCEVAHPLVWQSEMETLLLSATFRTSCHIKTLLRSMLPSLQENLQKKTFANLSIHLCIF